VPVSANTKIAHKLIDHQVSLLRVSAGVKRDVFALLNRLEKKIVGELADAKLTEFGTQRYRNMLGAVQEATKETFVAADKVTEQAVERVMLASVQQTAAVVESTVGINLLGETVGTEWVASLAANSMTQGATNAAWWGRQAQDLVFKFEQAVRFGMVANETTDKIIARVRGDDTAAGILFQTRANAASLVQTAIAEGANTARLEMFRRNADIISGVQQVSTLDDRTTEICAAYDGATWDLDGEPIGDTDLPFDGGPPRHFNCRSTLVPIVKSSEELGTDVEVDEGARASMDGEVADSTSFADWLGTKTEDQQDAILGAGKAELWRDGKITLRDLLDQSGRPLTLEQLRESVAPTSLVGSVRTDALTGTATSIDVEKLTSIATSTANDFGVPLDSVHLVDKGMSAVVNGQTLEAAGWSRNGHVYLNAAAITDKTAGYVVAHEMQHVRFDAVESLVRDTIKDSFRMLRTEDGITDYSKMYWQQYESFMRNNLRAAASEIAEYKRAAVSETLSEIAAVATGGRVPIKPTAEVWQNLYKEVAKEYARVTKAKP
jgi:SPP1 gp7 family putative phage head morphogenesis protein